MGRYYEMREYACPADYYERGNLGSRSPQSIAEQEHREARDRADTARRVSEEMRAHRELYGD